MESRPGSNVPTLIVLVLCVGIVYWAYRKVMDNQHPLAAAARNVRGGSTADRLAAIEQVKELGLAQGKESIPPLVGALGDADPATRAAAAQALGLIVSYAVRVQADAEVAKNATSALVERLRDADAQVRVASAKALTVIAATVPGGGKRSGGKKAAAIAKGTLAAGIDPATLAKAYLSMLADKDPSIRAAAAEGLGSLGPALQSPPDPALIAALDDPQASVRLAAVEALIRYPSGLDPAVSKFARLMATDADSSVQQAVAGALGRISPASITSVSIPALGSTIKTSSGEVVYAVVGLLERMDAKARTEAIPVFLDALDAPGDSDRPVGEMSMVMNAYTGPAQVAARAIAKAAPGTPLAAQAVSALAGVLRRDNPRRWPAAADALAAFGPQGTPAVPALLEVLKKAAPKQEIANAATAAIKTLATVAVPGNPPREVIEALQAAAKSPVPAVRQEAEGALSKLQPQAAAKKTT